MLCVRCCIRELCSGSDELFGLISISFIIKENCQNTGSTAADCILRTTPYEQHRFISEFRLPAMCHNCDICLRRLTRSCDFKVTIIKNNLTPIRHSRWYSETVVTASFIFVLLKIYYLLLTGARISNNLGYARHSHMPSTNIAIIILLYFLAWITLFQNSRQNGSKAACKECKTFVFLKAGD